LFRLMVCLLAMPDESLGQERALIVAFQFVRRYWLRILVISAFLLVPCFWHRHIVASDLGSHVYNAWLAQLIGRGEAPGLWLAPQRTNVLFDFMLSGFGPIFGMRAAERIAVSLAILIFFWGAFALVAAAARRAPWFLSPFIAMVAFGYTFHMGFFNFYLALGFSFFGLAILWRGTGEELWAILVLVPLMFLAHPIGLIWFVAAAAYIGFAERIPTRLHAVLFVAAVAGLVAIHFYFAHHYITEAAPTPLHIFNGTDQLLLFGARYRILANVVLAFGVAALVCVLFRGCGERFLALAAIPLELYLLTLLAVPLLPRGITFGPNIAPIALLTERLTSVSAVLGICLLATLPTRRWHLAGSLLIATVFFFFVYQDTAKADRMETQVEHLVRTLPANQRVLASIRPFPGSRILIQHMIDRACIGHCFSYGNYEPASGVFRVRATPGNPYALSDYDTAVSTEAGEYLVQPEDLPIYQVYECGPDGTQLCIEALQAGQANDRDGVHRAEDH
jgi:hypothetical protein